MKRRNLMAVLEASPYPHSGCRGVSREIYDLREYMRTNDLIAVPKSDIAEEIARRVGKVWRTISYHEGSKHKRATYTSAGITGKPEFDAALAAAPAGLATYHGLLLTTPEVGVRDEWKLCRDGKRWKRVRRWRKLRGVDTLVTGKRVRIGRYSAQLAHQGGRMLVIVSTHSGPANCTQSRVVVRTTNQYTNDLALALRTHVRSGVVGPKKQREAVPVTSRMLRRLCPPEWQVVFTPASQGAEPTPAFRETATGEEYHFTSISTARRPVHEAREAFARRAAQRDQEELAAIVDRGEAAEVYLCAADSYRAGNCRAGTASFAQRHNLDLGRHYRAGELAEQANGDGRFVRAAIIAGLRRERREVQQGYCVIADHRGG